LKHRDIETENKFIELKQRDVVKLESQSVKDLEKYNCNKRAYTYSGNIFKAFSKMRLYSCGIFGLGKYFQKFVI
jgi:hypothetical protein